MPEKLLSIKEVADYLGLSEEEVKRLVDIGEIPAYKIGGTFLRFRREQVDAIKNEIDEVEEAVPEHGRPVLDRRGNVPHHLTELEMEIRSREPAVRQYEYSAAEKIKDFIYFYDFYILSSIAIVVLLLLIFNK